jgi:[protein-PII] uridylyltransferase
VGRLPSDYLLSFTPEAVVDHIRVYRENVQELRKKALVFPREFRQHWSLLIMARDRSGLLAKICGVLALHNLSVLSAQIFTWESGDVVAGDDDLLSREPGMALAVDVLEVRSLDGLSFVEKDWQAVNADLDRALSYRLGLGHRIHHKLAAIYERRKLPETMLLGQQKARVVIDNDASDGYTVIEVHSEDRSGQLYHITQTLADFGINIYRAFIATEVQQLIDIFYVLDSEGQKIVEESFASEIRDGILYAMERVS